jgi:hypothetical protein
MEALRMTPARQAHDWTFYVVLLAIAQVLIFAVSVRAIDVPEECRVGNWGGRCVASSLETLGRYHGERSLYGLRNQSHEGVSYYEVEHWLTSRRVPRISQPPGTYSYDTLRAYANGHGVFVSMNPGTPWGNGYWLQYGHAIVLTGTDDYGVWFYCPNTPDIIRRGSWAWFAGRQGGGWQGNAIVIWRQPPSP